VAAINRIFERWFAVLVKNKMAAAAVPIAGISIGYLVVELSRTVPDSVRDQLTLAGALLMEGSMGLLFLAIAGLVYFLLAATRSDAARKKR
jgi:hypothetical protein